MRVTLRRWRLDRIAMVAVLLFASVLPLLKTDQAQAAILANREIKMSSSAVSAASTTYHTEFDIGTSGNVQGIIVEFCANTPIVGDTTCTAPTGFSITASPAVSGQSTGAGATADLSTFLTANDLGSNSRTLILTAGSAVLMDATDTAYFDITTVTNPSTLGTFFARIYTYATSAAASAYTIAAPGAYVDAGGVALSTVAQITVTAKVAERIIFCVYTDDADPDYDDNDCDSQQGTGVSLGDTNGVLDPSGPFVDKKAKYTITTNASQGAIIRLKGTTLTKGSDTITAIGSTPATVATGGAEQFGLCSYRDTATTAGLAVDEMYNGATASEAACATTAQTAGTGATGGSGTPTPAEFAFDVTTSNDNVLSTYGDTLATKTAGNYSTGIIAFAGNIGNSTEAGIYTTLLTFIATGTY
ncbi:MAG TPA: hypothetical protein VK674_06440 [Candidatus Limnocylindria bacterium]|nr:hypothetical protein [Candidatus Limnocylindria bacterium]